MGTPATAQELPAEHPSGTPETLPPGITPGLTLGLTPGLSVAVLVYNRRAALQRTLLELRTAAVAVRDAFGWPLSVAVADNASIDGSGEMVAAEFPEVELVRLARNAGAAGFNAAAACARHDFLLITDDDSWPDPASLVAALHAMRNDPKTGGVMLHRRHPRSDEVEWPGRSPALEGVQHLWPDMGCLNLVRTSSWRAVGGYDPGFFLYRNDTDLALKLLARGDDVLFNPAWFGFHDSPHIGRKNRRWFRLSTRNWTWMSRRHGRGASKLRGAALGWARAHLLARLSIRAHAATLRGLAEGVFFPPPELPPGMKPDGTHYRRLINLKLKYRG